MKTLCLVAGLVLLAPLALRAELRLPAILSDHAMLQAGKPVAIWGWADPGAHVTAAFTGADAASSATVTATADATGRWSAQLPALKSGTAGRLDLSTDKGEKKTINDLLAGEVWLGGGQSNMAYDIAGKFFGGPANAQEAAIVAQNVARAKAEADAARPPLRYFSVQINGADAPLDDVKGKWELVNSTNVLHFSAVAWFFGVTLQDKLRQPVGLIVSCVGGTPVEAWMSKETLASTSVGAAVEDRFQKALAAVTPEVTAKYNTDLQAWLAANPTHELQVQNGKTKPRAPFSKDSITAPIHYYNGMIHGLEPYTLRGVIWFQADGNLGHPLEYAELFQALIKEWRAEWNEPRLPFYFVEMNNMRQPPQTLPVQPNPLSILREQQHAGLLQPGVGMVCSIDLGTENPHFPNKQPVGERLAGLALRDVYGTPGAVESPVFTAFQVEGNKARVTLTHAEGLRTRDGGEVKGFALRGATGDWVWAQGKIDGTSIVLWSDQVAAPAAVRYAWAMNPVTSVENGAGLPLVPFRTDTASEK